MVSVSILQKGSCRGTEDLGKMWKFGNTPCGERPKKHHLVCLRKTLRCNSLPVARYLYAIKFSM